jgi:hypothetical protein
MPRIDHGRAVIRSLDIIDFPFVAARNRVVHDLVAPASRPAMAVEIKVRRVIISDLKSFML